jgi:hypothetical protein
LVSAYQPARPVGRSAVRAVLAPCGHEVSQMAFRRDNAFGQVRFMNSSKTGGATASMVSTVEEPDSARE